MRQNPSWLAPGTGVLYEVFLPPNTFEEIDSGEESFEQLRAYHASGFGSRGFYAYTLIPYGGE
jgi:hypothetical protein